MKSNTTNPKASRHGARASTGFLLAAVACLSLLFPAASALAGTASDRPLLFTFNGGDTTAGAFGEPVDVAIDQSTGNVYVYDAGRGAIDKFNSEGAAATFTATGKSSITGLNQNNSNGIAVDNSSANPGRVYFSQFGPGTVSAFAPSGNFLWEIPHASLGFQPCDVAVDTAGHVWVASAPAEEVVEYDNTGNPPAQIGSFNLTNGAGTRCRLAIDASNNLYIATSGRVDKYVGGVFDSTLDPAGARSVDVDQSSASGHILTVHKEDFSEYDSSGALFGTFGAGTFGGGFESDGGKGIAYRKSLDRVYVANQSFSEPSANVVMAFGEFVEGTVPDVTIEPTTDVGISKATFHGTVNPLSVPNSYHFEWKVGTGSSWAGAKSSLPQSLPEDSNPHAVSFGATGLEGNKTYQVRLVGVNTELSLRAVSSADQFTTATAPAPPTLTIDPPSEKGTKSVRVSATINPQGDFGTTYRFQTSTDPACASGFSNPPLQILGSEATTGVPVSEEMTSLLPAEHYCVRITATNSAGTATSGLEEFETLPEPPTEVETAFVSPRLDTSARLNGRVNPEGVELTYHFEYSEDGGETWKTLPDQTNTSEARAPIVVAQGLTDLAPDTIYSYRFVAENAAGPASPQGESKAFTTRTSEELVLPEPRGIELVNNPDKGNQHALNAWGGSPGPPTTPDGETVLWSVAGGAPGGYNRSGNTFLAERTKSGWQSKSVAPPPDQQVGGGGWSYGLRTATPDLSRSVFRVQGPVESAVVRLDRDQNQNLLRAYPEGILGVSADLTDDGAHVVLVNPETRQLEDVGSGTPEVLSLMPDGTESSCGLDLERRSFRGPFDIRASGAAGAGTHVGPGYHMIAASDASRVYFQVPPNGACGGLYGLYVRNREAKKTTLIDPITGGHSPEFIRATPDGRSAYFATYSTLDSADTNTHGDVYRWDEKAGKSRCLTCEAAPDVNLHANSGRLTRILVSDDFSHIYFESAEQLALGATPGHVSIYALSGGTIRFVADTNNSEGQLQRGVEPHLSADGNVLVFEAKASPSLTADAVASQCTGSGGEATQCSKIYRYDDSDGSLECLDCLRGGLSTHTVSGDFEMSGDGSTVAFTTAEALVPLDVNNDTDVYEWRNGLLRLITDGVSDFQEGAAAPQVWNVDADGSDILFAVVSPGLTGFERDGLLNLYNARIGGGFEPPTPPAHCTEDSCQGSLQAAPPLDQPGSSTYSGSGNVKAHFKKRRCAHKRGKARRRCVKKRRCAHKRGKARRRCVRKHRRHSRSARAQGNASRAK